MSTACGLGVFMSCLKPFFLNSTLKTHSIFPVTLACVSDDSVGAVLGHNKDPALLSRPFVGSVSIVFGNYTAGRLDKEGTMVSFLAMIRTHV